MVKQKERGRERELDSERERETVRRREQIILADKYFSNCGVLFSKSLFLEFSATDVKHRRFGW